MPTTTETALCKAEIAKMGVVQLTRIVIAIASDADKTEDDCILEAWINEELDQRVERKRAAEYARRAITDRRSVTAWNVYELSATGRTLLCEVTGQDARKAAQQFGRDWMAEHGGRVTIMKNA